jgi:hypothetical protein
MSAAFAVLPTEILLQIAHDCIDASSLCNLVATCRRIRHIWFQHTTDIVSRLTGLTIPELKDAVVFARQEHDVQHQNPLTKAPEYEELNVQVRRSLTSITTTARHCDAISARYAKLLAAFKASNISHNRRISHQCPDEDATSVCKSYLAIRRLVLGYDHFELLGIAYADKHASDDISLDDINFISSRVLCRHLPGTEVRAIDINNDETDALWWDCDYVVKNAYFQPVNWEFAYYLIWLISTWRFDQPGGATDYQQAVLKLQDSFGHDRTNALFGSIEKP